MEKRMIVSLMGCFLSVGALCAMEEVRVEKEQVLEEECVEIAKLLIEQGAELSGDNYGNTALMRAAVNGHIEFAKLLVESGAYLDVQEDNYGATALTWYTVGLPDQQADHDRLVEGLE